ncbi:putative filament-like plant protein [Dioscorea sansibarensis]
MEHKTWLWRKKPSEKTITANGKADVGIDHQENKTHEILRSLEELNEQLLSSRAESIAKDDLLVKQATGLKKSEEEAASIMRQLDDALLQKAATEERLKNSETSLKEYTQQLRIIKVEHQDMMNDMITKLSKDQARTRVLEGMLAETNKKLGDLEAENTNLCTILQNKEKLIEDLSVSKFQSEEKLRMMVLELDASEKKNSSLKYEVCMLQKELDVRNEERDFSLRSADAARKQHLENIKKITKLEAECQKLRVMVRKRLPGPAALAKMRSEVEILGNNADGGRRKKSNTIVDDFAIRNFAPGNCHDASLETIASLVEKLNSIDDENKSLREALTKKSNELQSSRAMFARIASKLSLAETRVEELSKGQLGLELVKSSPTAYDLHLAPISEDRCDEDSISCAESWASALISELEHFRNGKQPSRSSRTSGTSELSLMDDFVEMEKLAIVCADNAVGCAASYASDFSPRVTTGKELIPVQDGLCSSPQLSDEISSNHMSFEKYPSWLRDILKVIVQKQRTAKVDLDTIIEEVRAALSKEHDSQGSFGEVDSKDVLTSRNNNQPLSQSNLEKSVSRLVSLTEGMIDKFAADNNAQQIPSQFDKICGSCDEPSSITGYVPHVFLFESSELIAVLRHFVVVSKDLLIGKADLVLFLCKLGSTVDWIINHCFSLQDVSHLKESIKDHCHTNGMPASNEFEARECRFTGRDEFERKRSSPLGITLNGLFITSQLEEVESKTTVDMRLKSEILTLETKSKDVEEQLKSISSKNESLITQLKKSEEILSNLHEELAKVKELKGITENEIVKQKLANDDLNSQLRVAKVELIDALQKLSSIEVELEEKNNCCEELEATCLELQLQLESVPTKEISKYDLGAEEKQLRTDLEISAASEKLAECQETILHLGKQLKALASPRDAVLFDKVVSSHATTKTNRRPLLLDQMQAEDDAKFEELKSPKTKEVICTEPQKPSSTGFGNPNAGLLYGRKILANGKTDTTLADIIQQSPKMSSRGFNSVNESFRQKSKNDAGALVVIPKRQKGGASFLRKLLSKRKRESKRKPNLPALC